MENSCGGRKSEWDASRDLISELPPELKEKILECLETRNAARTALLSTHWNHVWLRHGQLMFDERFFQRVSEYERKNGMGAVNIINDILMLRAGPVKKFTLDARHSRNQQYDLDRWCRFLSRNGLQELHLFISRKHKLPSCIISCPTIKKLFLGGFNFDFSVPGCIFPGVTSLVFKAVEFIDNVKGIVYSIPNLEELIFSSCKGVSNFEISAPKLESLSVIGSFSPKVYESRWFLLYLKTIKALCLSAALLPCKNAEMATVAFPTAMNLKVIELYDLNVSCGEKLAFVLQLIQNSHILCELRITAINCLCLCDDKTLASRLLEDPNTCIFNRDLKILNTIMIEGFSGTEAEMLFVKMLLLKSPVLERVLIQEHFNIDASIAVKNLRELLRFPRASPKAQIVCTKYNDTLDYISF